MLLGPVRSFSRSRFLISSILDPFRFNFGFLGCTKYCVFLQDRECSSSATRKFSPNPSYLLSGELVLPWDTKNRSSHTQIVHIDILRAQMYLKSAIWAHGPMGPMGPWAHWAQGPGPKGPLGPGPLGPRARAGPLAHWARAHWAQAKPNHSQPAKPTRPGPLAHWARAHWAQAKPSQIYGIHRMQ